MKVLRALVPTLLVLLVAAPAAGAAAKRDFPRSFLWGTAIAGLQAEAGGQPSNADPRSDWWVWSHDPLNIERGWVTGDLIEKGPGHWRLFRKDIDLAAERLRASAYRFSVEWSRVFPRSTASVRVGRRISVADLRRLDKLANHAALRHYAAELRVADRRGLEPFVTVSHFSLPTWVHDPIAVRDALAGRGPDEALPRLKRGGWLSSSTVREFRKYAAYLAWKLGRRVTFWTPLNEPLVVAANGFVNVPGAFAGYFPPGAFSFSGAIRVVTNLVRANAAAYDAIHRFDSRARVGPVHNMIAFTPTDPASARDRSATRHADYLFNRLFLNAVVRGRVDLDVDGRIEPSERLPKLGGKADYLGVNYYFRGRVTGPRRPDQPAHQAARLPAADLLRHARPAVARALPHHVHGLRLGGVPRGLPALAEDGRRLRPPHLRDRERPGRR